MITAISHLWRLGRAGVVMAREGVFDLIDPLLAPPALRLPLKLARLMARSRSVSGSSRLSTALTRLGPSYVKLGQVLATRPDLVGVALARDLESLQDRMPPFPLDQAQAQIAADFSRPAAELFHEMQPAVAAASIAQVHQAVVTDGLYTRRVAVKILRPGIRERFLSDLASMAFAARLAERMSPEARRLRMTETVQTIARSVMMEMDLRLEAAALSEFAEHVALDPDFSVPEVDWERTSRHVLTTRWVEATPLSSLASLPEHGQDLPRLAVTLIQSFLRHALRDGFFHADMHPGNLFVDAAGRLVAVDFGITGRLGLKERRFLAEILYGFITRDYLRVSQVHFDAGYVPAHHSVADFAMALRAVGEPIHSRRSRDISMARLLGLLFEITALYDMETRPELILLQKTMVVVEGVARMLDPDFDMWSSAEPVVRQWIEDNLGVRGQIQSVAADVQGMLSAARRVPDVLERLDRMLERQSRCADVSKREFPRSGVLALWLIAALLGVQLFVHLLLAG